MRAFILTSKNSITNKLRYKKDFSFSGNKVWIMCKWTGVTRGDSTSWKDLYGPVKEKKIRLLSIGQSSYLKAFKEWNNRWHLCLRGGEGGGRITPRVWWSHCETEGHLKHLKMCQISKSRSILYLHLCFFLVMCCYSKMLWWTHHRSISP